LDREAQPSDALRHWGGYWAICDKLAEICDMPTVVFYENPDKALNSNQKKLIAAAGHEVETRDLTAENWTPAALRAYFGDRPVADWFDPRAPKILSGEIDPDKVNPQAALIMMSVDPSLIKSPLVKFEDRCASGLDAAQLDIFLRGARDVNALWTTKPPAAWGED
jgi:nitrogenase-associated protein